MKPKGLEWIPFFGYRRYVKRYYAGEKRTAKEATTALWVENYHFGTSMLILVILLSFFI